MVKPFQAFNMIVKVKVMPQQGKSCDTDCQSVACRIPASEERGWLLCLKCSLFGRSAEIFYGDIVTLSEVICENGGHCTDNQG